MVKEGPVASAEPIRQNSLNCCRLSDALPFSKRSRRQILLMIQAAGKGVELIGIVDAALSRLSLFS
jgi:hypothetical protein